LFLEVGVVSGFGLDREDVAQAVAMMRLKALGPGFSCLWYLSFTADWLQPACH